MKKLIFTLIISWLTTCSFGNLLIAWEAKIFEIYFDSAGNWSMEIGIRDYSKYMEDPHEILDLYLIIESSSGSTEFCIPYDSFQSWWCSDYYWDYPNYSIITESDVYPSLTINPDGDFVKITSHDGYYILSVDSVAFGNYPGSYLDCRQPGESIIWMDTIDTEQRFEMQTEYGEIQSFCISCSPSIGECNLFCHASGLFSGLLLDTIGDPMTDIWFFQILNGGNSMIYINSNGEFSNEIVARRYNSNTIRIYYSNETFDDYAIEPVDFCLRPDSSYYHVIQTTALITATYDEPAVNQKAVTVSPNPFTGNVTFYIDPGLITSSEELNLSVYDTEGRSLLNTALSSGQTRYDWAPGSSVNPGMLVYRLDKNGVTAKSGKLIRL